MAASVAVSVAAAVLLLLALHGAAGRAGGENHGASSPRGDLASALGGVRRTTALKALTGRR